MIERAYYKDKISTFLNTSPDQILGELSSKHNFALDIMQRNAWIEQIATLKKNLSDFQDDYIFFEFSIPRMGKRVDVLLVIEGVIFVVECKIGAKNHDGHAIDQVLDYALDLKNFHEGSHDKYIVPILISTRAARQFDYLEWFADHIAIPLHSNGNDLSEIIGRVLSDIPAQRNLETDKWAYSGYKPTPTIVEAAQALYRLWRLRRHFIDCGGCAGTLSTAFR